MSMGETCLFKTHARGGHHFNDIAMGEPAASSFWAEHGNYSSPYVLPRKDKIYCYICGEATIIERTSGDQDRLRLHSQDVARSGFYSIDDIDVEPVTCIRQSCRSMFKELPTLKLLEYNIPYRKSTVSDEVPFSDYPQCYDSRLVNDREIFNYVQEATEETLEVLLQHWLFFGFLRECLGDFYDRKRYIRADESGMMFLSLEPLITTIFDWMRSEPLSGEHAEHVFLSVVEVLNTSRKILMFLKFHNLNANLRDFLAFMAETFASALNALFPGRPAQQSFLICGTPLVVDSLVASGWCKHEAQKASTTMMTLSMKALYQHVDRRGREIDHRECSLDECVSSKIVYAATNGPTHRSGCSEVKCELVRLEDPQMRKACSLFAANKYPLLSARTDAEGHIELQVVPYVKGRPYVAISHVWAQGLGNKADNGLNRCQLDYLISCMSKLWSRTFSRDEYPLHFWLDTFCCPVSSRVDSELRKVAISLMRDTYENASYVLVIDTELEGVRVRDYSSVEIGCRISVSSWASRLWTMHEGQLPYHLWFQFQDGAMNSHSLWLALRAIKRGTDLTARILAGNVLLQFEELRVLCGRYYTLGSVRQILAVVTRGMQNRATTWDSDEAICMSNILHLDTMRIQATTDPKVYLPTDHEERMKDLWDQLSERGLIPRGAAFCVGPRMRHAGYKWAHSTFLDHKAALGFQNYSPLTGIATDRGLKITASGMVFARATPVVGFDMRTKENVQPMQELFVVKTTANRYKRFAVMDTYLEDMLHVPMAKRSKRNKLLDDMYQPNITLALLQKHLTSDPTSQGDGTCLLVRIIKREGNTIWCERLHLGNLNPLPQSEEASIALAVYHADRIRDHDLFKRFQQLEGLPHNAENESSWRQMHKEVKHLFAFDKSLLDVDAIPGDFRRIGPDGGFEDRVGVALAGGYAIVSEVLPEQTQWYVD